ncbi:Dyp-type peroxidase [Nocardioides sp. zg-579]|uniref:Dyp-type peroxidase n=1 Tax=Nocardioides marmotae TaxID=2663857 RepID=A0A6I3J0R9_9ACTN|nr:Dyp-type peroxidase [Nocardioides marmotae]MCR6031458.1 Dyp-type peroxidase [Gordonia jinghuaiqii]MTB95097.1 Dyp-type peroxidase [Nocardioides marmotae]QKE02411.1 Dyp-type peroxidase [Nocardioides marmotae]
MSTSGVGRRGFLGYVGTAVAGAAAGAGGVALAGSAGGAEGTPAPDATAWAGRTIAPYGAHQPGVATSSPHVTELVALDLLPGADRDALGRLMRVWTGDVEALTQGRPAPGDTAPWLAGARADLTITVGAGPGAFGPRLLGEPPAGFGTVPPMRHDRLQERWNGGDLVLVVAARDATTVAHAVRRLVADAAPFATPRWRQHGSWNGVDGRGQAVTGRNLFGQVDGSANPRPGTDLFDETVWIDEGDWAGGTTLVVRRIRMDLDTWDELTRDEQERSVGRRLDDGAPLTGGEELDDVDLTARTGGRPTIARDAHARRSHPDLNGGRRIFRKGANYVLDTDRGVESGLLFQSFQADLLDQFVPIQRSIDELDALNEWTTAIGSASFVVLPGFEEGGWLGQVRLG